MAKRIVTRIGNVFCAEIDNECKRFFQYVANDIECLNSSVIRVFKTKYPMDYKPKVEEIVGDEVEFYAHTILKFGIVFNAWYKVGTSKNIGEGHKEALFGSVSLDIYENPNMTKEERKNTWRELEKKYLPHKNYEGCDFLEKGTWWFKQGHIFKNPFYYILKCVKLQ